MVRPKCPVGGHTGVFGGWGVRGLGSDEVLTSTGERFGDSVSAGKARLLLSKEEKAIASVASRRKDLPISVLNTSDTPVDMLITLILKDITG